MNSDHQFQVIYLTGAPATGKSTLTENLYNTVKPLKVFAYSKELSDYISHRSPSKISENELREKSAKIVTHQDVKAVDNMLLELVKLERKKSHIVIDSHAVTKENYGYRVTPFSLEMLQNISPTIIIVLYTEGDVVRGRVKANDQGRPLVSIFEADFHTNLQASVALIYAINLGVPIYFFDSNLPKKNLVGEICNKILK